MEYWHGLIEANMHKLSAEDKVRLGKWGMELLVGKMKEISSPTDSKQNVEETMKLLKEMESKVVK
jgi:hypothetical protein